MGLGDIISGIFGSHNKEAEEVKPYQTDPNAYQYGGHPGGAQQQASIYGNTAHGYTQGAYNNFGAAEGDRGAAYQARDQQQDALGLAAQRAHGQNLISQQITAQQQQQAAAQQQGLAASARGPAALAMAQQNAAANTGQATAQLGAQGAIAGAQEQLANQQAYAGQAGAIRGQDLAQMGASTQLGAAQGQIGLGYAGLENNVNQAQLAAQMNQQAQNSANYNAAHGIQAGAAGQNAAMNQQNALGLIGGITHLGGTMAAAAAKGGHIQGQSPYLVGEEGPELVVPRKDGFVLTALQTAALRGAPPTAQQLASLPHHGAADAVLAFMGNQRTRAEGGPVYGAIGAPALAPSTWGTTQLSAPEQQELAERQALADRAAEFQAYQYGGAAAQAAEKRDKDYLATLEKQRALGIEAPQDAKPGTADAREAADQAALERKARYATGQGKTSEAKQQKEAAAAAAKDGQAYAKGRKIGDMIAGLGGGLEKQAAGVDVSYHGPEGGGAAPQLLALPTYQARAAGGSMAGGGFDPSMPAGAHNRGELGEEGVAGLVSGTIGHENDDVKGAVGGAGGGGMAGKLGGGMSAFGDAFSKIAGGIDTSYHPVAYAGGGLMRALQCREDGGPVAAAQKVEEKAAERSWTERLKHAASRIGEAVQSPGSVYGRMALAAALPPVGIASQAAQIAGGGTQMAMQHPEMAADVAKTVASGMTGGALGHVADAAGTMAADAAAAAARSPAPVVAAMPAPGKKKEEVVVAVPAPATREHGGAAYDPYPKGYFGHTEAYAKGGLMRAKKKGGRK